MRKKSSGSSSLLATVAVGLRGRLEDMLKLEEKAQKAQDEAASARRDIEVSYGVQLNGVSRATLNELHLPSVAPKAMLASKKAVIGARRGKSGQLTMADRVLGVVADLNGKGSPPDTGTIRKHLSARGINISNTYLYNCVSNLKRKGEIEPIKRVKGAPKRACFSLTSQGRRRLGKMPHAAGL